MIVDPEQSLVLYPELQRLVDLRDAGWSFSPRHNPDGELVGINGLRVWPEGQADALRVKSPTDTAALRCDHTGGVLWERQGTLVEVVDGLLELPLPGARLAPCLVSGTVPLWTP